MIDDSHIANWQSSLDLLAEVIDVPAALIMEFKDDYLEVFISSHSEENPYKIGDRELFEDSGLYCEKVIKTKSELLVPNAIKDDEWKDNPDIRLGMISYLGFPLKWPNGEIFGTICVLDKKENSYSLSYKKLLEKFRDNIELDLTLIGREIETQKRNEELSYYKTMISQTADLMVIVDRNYVYQAANPAYLYAFAKTSEEIIGLSVSDVLGQKQFEGISKPNIDRAFAGEEQAFQAWIDFPGIGHRFMDLFFSPVRDTDGMISFCAATIHDTTELKLTEEKLQRANEMIQEKNDQLKYEVDVKNKFFSIIAHDLRSPFNAFLGLTYILSQKADKYSRKQIADFANTVHEEAERVYNFLQNLLDWSRLQIERGELEVEILSLQKLTQESISILKPIAIEKNITLTNTIKESIALADRNMIQTVIRNLTANALKFTPSGGLVEVSSCEHGNMVMVTVSDTGVGISKEHAQQIFSLDQKTSTMGTNGETGTGLGLPLCKDMIEKQGGHIWFESTPGKGAAFHFTLPVKHEEK